MIHGGTWSTATRETKMRFLPSILRRRPLPEEALRAIENMAPAIRRAVKAHALVLVSPNVTATSADGLIQNVTVNITIQVKL